MNKKYLIYIGLGILAYYLWKRNKNKQNQTIDVEAEVIEEADEQAIDVPAGQPSHAGIKDKPERSVSSFAFDSMLGDIY